MKLITSILSISLFACFSVSSAAKQSETISKSSALEAVSLRQVEACHRSTTGLSTSYECRPQWPCAYSNDKVFCQLLLKQLLLEAFQLKPYALAAPDWVAQEMYVLQGILPPNMKNGDGPRMLQTALVERLGIRSHTEKRMMKVLVLVPDPMGLHLTPALPPEKQKKLVLGNHTGAAWVRSPGSFSASAMSLDRLGELIQSTAELDRPVLNGTGLDSKYTFELHWPASDNSPDIGILEALRKQAGLTLKKETIPVDVLVIDHINRIPTPNP